MPEKSLPETLQVQYNSEHDSTHGTAKDAAYAHPGSKYICCRCPADLKHGTILATIVNPLLSDLPKAEPCCVMNDPRFSAKFARGRFLQAMKEKLMAMFFSPLLKFAFPRLSQDLTGEGEEEEADEVRTG